VLVGRLVEEGDETRGTDPEDLVRVLHVLTSFETFDGLAKSEGSLTAVLGDAVNLVKAVLR
jgi:hypothetical protein